MTFEEADDRYHDAIVAVMNVDPGAGESPNWAAFYEVMWQLQVAAEQRFRAKFGAIRQKMHQMGPYR